MGINTLKLTYVHHCGSDLTVVNSARVSFAKFVEEFIEGKDDRLINFLAREDHHSPFNHSFLTCHVKAPIFVARQLAKHKFMPWNEVSRRYVDDPPEFYWPKEWRVRSVDKKQGSGGLLEDSSYIKMGEPDMENYFTDLYFNLINDYGVAPEQARMILPLNTYTEWYWSGTLGAWMDMYNLRSKSDTQWETQQIALQAGDILQTYWPYSFEAYCNRTEED